ncbi:SDR family NAD(P)-dependent oxidoreductase [Streptomyces morookaense]|uniref:SDR family oxidoreductase n=1 Tax=Streptomyces morookaense TaxID=1970 RepID=A0A7Y7B7E1_STRMO|nr:SDR family oxidoreductase [Streptomyces morookaense]NVK80275.1 SDR family oxidoreductase [Streptomyces morookaense]GHF40056.1 gluconate 5-dehydrogenase [Streptomyces morookaense]
MHTHPTFRLDGTHALVTGASRGIGRAIALALAEAGADVAITARNTTALDALAEDIAAQGHRALALTCDATNLDQITACVQDALTGLGHIDILVNAAGVIPSFGPFLDLPEDDWNTILETNFLSTVRFCRLVGPHLLERGRGSVINMSSVAGVRGVPSLSHYAATKAALISLSRSLAAEWAQGGVRVNAVCPGWTRTKMTAQVSGNTELSGILTQAVPAQRWGEVDDLVGTAIYLASDASRFVTGQTLTVDGGLTAYEGGPGMLGMTTFGRVQNTT